MLYLFECREYNATVLAEVNVGLAKWFLYKSLEAETTQKKNKALDIVFTLPNSPLQGMHNNSICKLFDSFSFISAYCICMCICLSDVYMCVCILWFSPCMST